jgi:type VI secretion system protein ImpA
MPLRDDLYQPIPGDKAGGVDLRYDPVYDKIKEARREDDGLAQGAWQRERKVADWPLVIKLTQDAIATRSKDLQLAAWMSEALVKKDGFAGCLEGLTANRELLARFWDNLYPPVEDGDLELRAAPLDWLGSRLGETIRQVALNRGGHDWLRFKESRTVGYEDQAKDDTAKKARAKLLKEGKLTPEEFDKGFIETPKVFYAEREKALDGCLTMVEQLSTLCDEKFGGSAPGFSALKNALTEVRHTVHQLLDKKRETEPDPVEEAPAGLPEGQEAADSGAAAVPARALVLSLEGTSEPPGRREAIEQIAAAAALLRKGDPLNPAPYMMIRGLRWGELRAGCGLSDARLLEAPPTEVRRQIKSLSLAGRWKELIETAESLMAFPYSRAWLDLQRFVVEACVALGPDYDAVAKAIRSELRALLRDVPGLVQATLMDDTPAANAETQKWLQALASEPDSSPEPTAAAANPVYEDRVAEGWRRNFVDSYWLAQTAMRSGDAQKAFEIMKQEIGRQRSGRGRFQRQLQLVQLCVSANKEAIAQPILEDLIAAFEAHKLEAWEDQEMVADALALIMASCKRIQGDEKEKRKIFEKICRLDPVRALTSG